MALLLALGAACLVEAVCPRSGVCALLVLGVLVRLVVLGVARLLAPVAGERFVAAPLVAPPLVVPALLLASGERLTSPLLTFALRLFAFRLLEFRSPVLTLLPTFTLVRLLSTLMFTLVRRGATTLLFGRYPGTGRT